jgi:DNA primase
MKQKILKIKVGDVFIDGKNHSVMQTAFQKTSKEGNTYYVISNPVFVQEIETKKEEKQTKVEA